MAFVSVPGDQVLATVDAPTISYFATSDQTEGVDRADPPETTLELPATLSPRIRALAEELGGTSTTQTVIARTLEAKLKARYGYTLELSGDTKDPLSAFLFDKKAGHCEDFATALAVMLRVRGVPSRVVTGFFGGERSGARYVVRSGDAHAWVEAFLEGSWVRLDATPDLGRSASKSSAVAVLVSLWEDFQEWWRSRVIDYSFQDQLGFARSLVRPPPGVDRPQEQTLSSAAASPRALVLAVGALLLVAGLWLGRRRRTRTHPATTFLARLEAALTRAGIVEASALPIEELSQLLVVQRHPLAPAVERACRRYLEARFGGSTLEVAEQERLLAALAPDTA
jgi:hypothetical protein